MVDQEITETTGLISNNPKPRYAFESSIAQKRRVRQFQCCVCALFLGIIIVAMVISVAYSINKTPPSDSPPDNSTLIVLLQNFPLNDLNVIHSDINNTEYTQAVESGKLALNEREALEETTPTLVVDTPSYRHQRVVATSPKARQLSRLGYTEEYGMKHLKRNTTTKKFCFNGTIDPMFNPYCNFKVNCSIFQKFRSYDGTCNNLDNPESFGVAYRPYRRILAADYSDGISSPRKSKSGEALPSARSISVVVHRPIYKEDPKFTIMLAVFGQFLDHDITATALSKGKNNTSISCCETGVHPECFPVNLDHNDSFYENYNLTCMEFVRSAPAPSCCFGAREQLNQASSYIDGSVIYGSETEVANRLRTFVNGSLKMLVTPDNRTLLPTSDDPEDGCNRAEENSKGRYCFMTGDGRANENLHLTSMHLLWARQHNHIAEELAKINPHWNDERIFQETRRIIGAQIQHVTYNELLAIILGDFAEKGLKPLKKGYYHGYNKSIDASIANGFAASTFRFAHTLIPTLVKMISSNSTEFIALHKMLFNPYKLYNEGAMDGVIVGAMNTSIQASDPYFTPELKQRMFEGATKVPGLDLVSLNIQRGRDHGLPGYTRWREHCGLSRPRNFKELRGDIDDESLNYIQSIYRDVDDIDFYTGSISERPVENGFLGPTITCMILDQFTRLKQGDRFWYENPRIPQAFTEQQLEEIRKSTLARIICDNSDNVTSLQKYVMKRVDSTNKVMNCTKIEKPDWSQWKESLGRVTVPGDGLNSYIIVN